MCMHTWSHTPAGMCANTHMQSNTHTIVCTLCQAGALCNSKGPIVGVWCGLRNGFLPEQSLPSLCRVGVGWGGLIYFPSTARAACCLM